MHNEIIAEIRANHNSELPLTKDSSPDALEAVKKAFMNKYDEVEDQPGWEPFTYEIHSGRPIEARGNAELGIAIDNAIPMPMLFDPVIKGKGEALSAVIRMAKPAQPAAQPQPNKPHEIKTPRGNWRDKVKAVKMTHTKYQTVEDQKYYIPNFLPEGGLVMFAGDSGVGKSWLAFAFSSTILRENPGKSVTFFDIDSGVVTTKKVVNILWTRHGEERFGYVNQIDADEDEIIEILKDMAEDDLSNEIIVLDSLASFTKGKINDSSEVHEFLKICEKLRNAGALVILIHHVKKPKEDEVIPTYAGSFMIKKALDALYMITNEDKNITAHQAKARGDYHSRCFSMDNYEGVIYSEVDYISPEQEKAASKQRKEDAEEDVVSNAIGIAEGNSKPAPLKTELHKLLQSKLNRSEAQAKRIITRMEKSKFIHFVGGLKKSQHAALGYAAEVSKMNAMQEGKNDDGTPF